MFEILDHTADIGFRAHGRTREELFAASAEALVSISLELENVAARESYALEAEGEDLESLLVNWLSDVLYWHDGKRVAMRQFEIRQLSETRLVAEAHGEPLDPARHHAKLMVKAVTWHQLRIAHSGAGWTAEVFLDV